MNDETIVALLATLKLQGMLEAYCEQLQQTKHMELCFDDRLGLLLDREILIKQQRRIDNLIKRAKLRHQASIEQLSFKDKRLDKAKIMGLAKCDFIKQHHNILITGATGCGKTYLACAIAHHACRLGFKVRYLLLPRFLEQLTIAHADGSYMKLMLQLSKEDLLLLDDFGLTPMTHQQRHDLFNLVEERYQVRSTIITSQLPIAKWHDYLNEPTIADAILDRLLEYAHRVPMKGESMRKQFDPS